MTEINVLISGVGEGIGFGIGRVLKDWGIFNLLHGIDITPEHPGELLFDRIEIAPRADSEDYLEWVCSYISEHRIGLFIPSSEAEISVVANNLGLLSRLTKVLVNPQHLIDICLDKHKTLEFLGSNGLAVPDHGLVGIDAPNNYPVIVKPRKGQGSKGIKRAFSSSELDDAGADLVWQSLLLPDEQEYTCAVYVDAEKNVETFQLKRQLIGGLTGKGVVVRDLAIESYLEKIVDILQFAGGINVQLRLTSEGPLVFEINPRLSNTLVFRDLLGFPDLRWWISDLLNLDKERHTGPVLGTRIYRGNIEYIVPPV